MTILIVTINFWLIFLKYVHLLPFGTEMGPVRIGKTPVYIEKYLLCKYQICEDPEDYPEDTVLRIIKSKQYLHGFFGDILNSTIFSDRLIGDRFGLGAPKRLCSVEFSGTFKPRVMRNVNMIWKYIVNVKGYYQTFNAEMCMSHKEVGLNSTDYCTRFGYTCGQNTAEVYLLTFENDLIDFDKFLVPTTCNCRCD